MTQAEKKTGILPENRGTVKSFLMQFGIYVVLLLVIMVIVAMDPSFLSVRNATFILQQAAPKLIIALGVAGILILGGTDLSAGKMVGMAGIISASLLQSPDYALRIYPNMARLPLIWPLLLAMAVCVVFSIVHSLLVSTLKIAPFIASLGMQMIVFGAMSLYFEAANHSSPIGGLDANFARFTQGSFYIGAFRIPYIVLYALVISVVFWVIWNRTELGRNMYAVGGNPEAAIVSGLNIRHITMLIYVIAGLSFAFAGFLDAGRTGSATNGLGEGYELDAIAACVVGGVSMRGGIGKIGGVIIGVMIFQVINYGLVYMNVNSYIQYIIKGLIIVSAIAVDTQKYIRKR